MEYQLRIYRVKPGATDEFLSIWREGLRPPRERHRFEVVGELFNEEGREFVLLVGYRRPEGYAAAEEAYYGSPVRHAVGRDPGPLVEATELRLLGPVRL
jgi:hypothetical protein